MLGPLYHREREGRHVVALRIEERHLDMRGVADGGVLVALADSALAIVLSISQTPPLPMAAVSLTTDFVEAARLGDWVEVHVDIQHVDARLAFASCHEIVGERRILRASVVVALTLAANQGSEA